LSRHAVLSWWDVVTKPLLTPGVALIRKGRALLIGATFFWGFSFPLIRALQLAQRAQVPRVPDSALAFADLAMRFGGAALLFLPFYAGHLASVTRREWLQAAGLALFGGVGLYLQTLGLAWTDASIAAFLTQLYSLIVPLIVAVRDRRAPGLRVVAACGMVLLGAALLSPGLLRHFVLGPGEVVILISTGFFAGQIVWVERPVFAVNRPGLITLLMFAFLGAAFVACYGLTGGTVPMAGQLFGTPAIVLLSAVAILFCTVVTFYIMNAWQRYVSATEAGLIYCIEPVVAAIFATFFPGWISRFAGIGYPNEMLSWSLVLGGSIIIAATVLVVTERRKD
jgi:drug/metabolite transporter (DMT)-like permease